MRIVCPYCFSVNNVPFKESYKKANCGKCKESLLRGEVLELFGENFDEMVINSDLPVVVDFWASWCGPCKQMAPTFSATSKEFALKAQFAKVETQQEQALAQRFDVRSIPTIIIFKEGKEVYRISGALSAAALKEIVTPHIPKA